MLPRARACRSACRPRRRMTLEAVATAIPDGRRWFQLYNVEDLDFTRSLVDRAVAAGYEAIVLTVDLPVLGYRLRDRHSGFRAPRMANLPPELDRSADRYRGMDRRDFALSWADIATIKTWSSLPLVLKGILTVDDARLAVEAGVGGHRRIEPRRSPARSVGRDGRRPRGDRRRRSGIGSRSGSTAGSDPASTWSRHSRSGRAGSSSAGRCIGRSRPEGRPASSERWRSSARSCPWPCRCSGVSDVDGIERSHLR